MKEIKRDLRKIIRRQIEKLSDPEIHSRSEQLVARILNISEFTEARIILSFMPLAGEPDLKPLNNAVLRMGKLLGLPRIYGKQMIFHKVDTCDSGLEVSSFGIAEPCVEAEPVNPEIFAEEKTLCIVPGYAFDKTGKRLGKGGGFFDRFLGVWGKDLTAMGICFSFQLLESIPVLEYDMPVDFVVTDESVIRC
ncbi:MAG: 5-formyltetrahydrofolate cyclo-ligase [Spirochaetia bacterium]